MYGVDGIYSPGVVFETDTPESSQMTDWQIVEPEVDAVGPPKAVLSTLRQSSVFGTEELNSSSDTLQRTQWTERPIQDSFEQGQASLSGEEAGSTANSEEEGEEDNRSTDSDAEVGCLSLPRCFCQ